MLNLEYLKTLKPFIRTSNQNTDGEKAIVFSQNYTDNLCISSISNTGVIPVKIKEIVLFSGSYDLAEETNIYAEGYSKLSQYCGNILELNNIGLFSDAKHYKMPTHEGFHTVYNLVLISPKGQEQVLMAFSSCKRFSGEFRLGKNKFEIVLDTEDLEIMPEQTWELEEFFMEAGTEHEELLEKLAIQITTNHPKLVYKDTPTGWCSWYCYGPDITTKDVFENMESIANRIPDLKFIQIDDGYQPYMGDWLETNPAFSGDIKELCLSIKEKGFEPAIWVAPFIAEKESKLFQEHPQWFVMDEDGLPLKSDRVSFGGWRGTKWYMLDGTHPGAQEYLIKVFKTMREEWKCTYFKLDANMWGAMHGGRRYDKNASRIEAYRKGMKAILEGAGFDSFILGCNAPMWPSLGTVHGMRLSDDICRSWESITSLARQMFFRNWQNNRLWINDPDAIVLENSTVNLIGPDGNVSRINDTDVTEDEFLFHASFIYATGGMVLSGDKVHLLSQDSIHKLKKLIPPPKIAAKFDDSSLRIGRIQLEDRLMLCIFNWCDEESVFEIDLEGKFEVTDFWTDEKVGCYENKLVIENMKPRSGKILTCVPIK